MADAPTELVEILDPVAQGAKFTQRQLERLQRHCDWQLAFVDAAPDVLDRGTLAAKCRHERPMRECVVARDKRAPGGVGNHLAAGIIPPSLPDEQTKILR